MPSGLDILNKRRQPKVSGLSILEKSATPIGLEPAQPPVTGPITSGFADFRQPQPADVTRVDPSYFEPDIPQQRGLLHPGTTEAIMGRISSPRLSLAEGLPGERLFESDVGEKIRRVAGNLALGATEFIPQMGLSLAEDPLGTAMGLVKFLPELSARIDKAVGPIPGLPTSTPLSPKKPAITDLGKQREQLERTQARQELGEDPFAVALAALPFLKGVKGMRAPRVKAAAEAPTRAPMAARGALEEAVKLKQFVGTEQPPSVKGRAGTTVGVTATKPAPPTEVAPVERLAPAPVKPPKAPGVARQPWEMTKGQFEENKIARSFGREKLPHGDYTKRTWDRAVGMRGDHKAEITEALSEGKPVPAEVLKDYPELGKPVAELPRLPAKPPKIEKVVEPTKPPVEAPKVEVSVQQPHGDVVGLNKAENARIRQYSNLEKLPEAEQITFKQSLADAKAQGLDRRALDIADEVLKSKRPVTKSEHAGMGLKATELVNEYDLSVKRQSDFINKGDVGAAQVERMRSEATLEQLDRLTEGARLGRAEAARTMSIGRVMIDRQDYSLARVMQRAQAAKGSKLTAKEQAKIQQDPIKLAKVEEALKELTAKHESTLAAQEKQIAEQVTKRLAVRQGKRVRSKKRFQATKSRLLEERADIKKQIAELGYKVYDITGASAESAWLIGRLAVNYIREGALTLDQVVKQVKRDIPQLTERDVYRGLNTRDPHWQRVARSEATKRITLLKRQANLIEQIKNAEEGIFAPSKARPTTPPEIRGLQKRLTELRASAYRSGMAGPKLERALRTINELQDQLANQYRAIKKRRPVEVEALKSAKEKVASLRKQMRTEDMIADLREQLRTGEFKRAEQLETKPVPPQLERMQIEARMLRKNIRGQIEGLAPWTFGKVAVEAMTTARTLKATADMSGALRQGFVLSVTRPVIFGRAFGKSFKSFFSRYKAEQIDNAIRSADHHYIREKSGLFVSPLEKGTRISAREEMFMSSFAEKIPGLGKIVKASEQHMVSFLNLMRTAAFDEFLMKFPNATHAELTAWADWVNVASGRGSLGKAAGAANALSIPIFAPRFAISRIQTPFRILKHWKEPRVRKAIAKDLAGVGAVGMTTLALADLAGWDVGTDPREPDFGKIRIGDTRIDIWAGIQQPMRVLFRIGQASTDKLGWTGQHLKDTQKDFDPLEVLWQFSRYKAAPAVTIPRELFTGETMVGEPVTPTGTAIRSITPLVYEDVYDAYRQAGLSRAALATGLAFFGVGVNTYADSQARVRRDIRKAGHAGDYTGALQMRLEWNIKHPDKKISREYISDAITGQ